MARNYYKEIDSELQRFENYMRPVKGISWCTNRIGWCWKFRKITGQQKDELCDRVITLFNIYGSDIFN